MSSTGPSHHAKGSDPAQLQDDVEHTRAELAATVDELADRLDVGAQARNLAGRARAAVLNEEGKPRPEALIAAAAVAGVVLLFVSRPGQR